MATLQVIKLSGNDISIVSGQTEVLTDADALAQILNNKIMLWLGEWALDTTQGVDWLGLFNQKTFLKQRFVYMLKKILIADTRVERITTLDIGYDRETREISVYFEVESSFGTVSGSV